MKKGDMKKLIELNLERKTALLKKIGYQTKKCRWEHEPGGCWSHKKGKCPYKHNCNAAKKEVQESSAVNKTYHDTPRSYPLNTDRW